MKQHECPIYQAPDYPQTYGELMDWAIQRVEEPEKKVFFRMVDDAVTYSEFGKNVNRVSNLLQRVGVRKGNHVAIFLQSCIEYAYLYHALAKIGAIMCPINPFVRGEPLAYILNHSDSTYLVTSNSLFSEKISGIIHSLQGLQHVLFTDIKVGLEGLESSLFSDFASEPTDFEPGKKVSGEDIQGIWYTSGTTGLPKGAVITNKAYVYRPLFFAEYFRLTPMDVIHYILPMYHVGYAVWGGPLAMAAGAEIVQVPWFSASAFWKEVVKYNATMTFSTGTIIPIMLNQPLTDEEVEGREKLRTWVGWPIDRPQSVRKRWPNIRFLEAYGTTESPIATISDYHNPEFGNAGHPTSYTNLKIIDPATGQEQDAGKVGEIVYGHKLGADYILKEYYKDPDKSKETIKDGHWHSGDLGLIDEKGRLKFSDRLKDYLRVGGENVSSAVVEAVIRRHPHVMEVAVVGSKGELGHDEVVAHIVPKDGASFDPRDFFEFCSQHMAYFMVPMYVILRSELPKTGTLRVEKYKLKEEGIPSTAINRNALDISLSR